MWNVFVGPRWASTNLGIFICMRCAGFHRSLGTHISKVKSVSLDSWTPALVEVSDLDSVLFQSISGCLLI